MPVAARSHYDVLGVDPLASAVAIKAAYRKLALRYHPDRNLDDRAAEDRFKEVSLAYAVLGDDEKRERYDRSGTTDGLPFGQAGDLSGATEFFDAIFGDIFGIGRKRAAGQDLRYTLELDFEEAALGCTKTIVFPREEDCGDCAGSGAAGGAAGLRACDRCDGQGHVRAKTGFLRARRECLACGGSGEVARIRCQGCQGTGLVERQHEYAVRVPPGSLSGGSQRVAGQGSPGRRGGPAGDLHVLLRVRSHPFYRFEEGILVCEVPLSPSEAALGAEIEVPLLAAKVRMKIPPGTQPGTVFRVKGKGLGAPSARTDAHVRVSVETPRRLSDEARFVYQKLSAALDAEDGALPTRDKFRRRKGAA